MGEAPKTLYVVRVGSHWSDLYDWIEVQFRQIRSASDASALAKLVSEEGVLVSFHEIPKPEMEEWEWDEDWEGIVTES